jgi:hypothetical protein
MTLKGAKPRQDLRLRSSEGCGRIDQDLARRANTLRAHRGSEDREFRVHVHLGTANSETPNPDIEPGIGISLMYLSGDFSFVGD